MSRAELEEELLYLRGSIEDLDRELAAGDVSKADYERLIARYRKQADEVERALGQDSEHVARGQHPRSSEGRLSPARSSRSATWLASPRARLVTGWGAFACLAAAAVLLGLALTSSGPFAGPAPLSVETRVRIMLGEAGILGSRGDVTQALATYDRVLALRPTQPVALANAGWLARLAGIAQHEPVLVSNGDAEIEAAVAAAPGYALARAYDGTMLLADRREPRLAASEFRAMLSDHPSAALVRSVRSEADAAFRAAGEPVPGAFAGAGGT